MLTQSAGPASLLFGSLAVWQFAVCHFSVWQFGKFPPFVDLSREAVSQTVLPHGLGIWRPFDAFFHVFFQKEEPKDVPKVNVLSTLRRQSRRSVRIEPSYRRATPPRASIRSRLTVPAVRVGSERRGHVLILEGSSERSLAEKPKATTCHQRAGTWSPSFRTPARRIPGLSLRSGSASSRLTIRARETTPRRFDAR